MNRSTNLNLYLPESSDYIAVSQLDYNFETIDDAIGDANGKFAWTNITCGSPTSGTLIHFDGLKNEALKLGYINCQLNGASAGTTLKLNNITILNSRTVQVYGFNAYNNSIINITIGADGTITFTDGGALIRFTAFFLYQ